MDAQSSLIEKIHPDRDADISYINYTYLVSTYRISWPMRRTVIFSLEILEKIMIVF